MRLFWCIIGCVSAAVVSDTSPPSHASDKSTALTLTSSSPLTLLSVMNRTSGLHGVENNSSAIKEATLQQNIFVPQISNPIIKSKPSKSSSSTGKICPELQSANQTGNENHGEEKDEGASNENRNQKAQIGCATDNLKTQDLEGTVPIKKSPSLLLDNFGKTPQAANSTVADQDSPEIVPPETDSTCYSRFVTVQFMDNFCNGQAWSCEGRCGQFRQVPCSCHPNCAIYKTCCRDYTIKCMIGMSSCELFGMEGIRDGVRSGNAPEVNNYLKGFEGNVVDGNGGGGGGGGSQNDDEAQGTSLTAAKSKGESQSDLNAERIRGETSSFDAKATASVVETTTHREDISELLDQQKVVSPDVISGTFRQLNGPKDVRKNRPTKHPAVEQEQTTVSETSSATFSQSPKIVSEKQHDKTSEANSEASSTILASKNSPEEAVKTSAFAHTTAETSQENGEASNNSNDAEYLEIPSARCVKAVQARLIDYCPKKTDPSDTRIEKCAASRPRDLSDVVPVTDPVTGLHFRNTHCFSCWEKYLARAAREKSQCSGGGGGGGGGDSGASGLQSPVAWEAELLMTHTSGSNKDTLLDIILHMVRDSVIWTSKDIFPHHVCVSVDEDVCPACSGKDENDELLARVSELCRSYTSSIKVGSKAYRNKDCALCIIVSELYDLGLSASGVMDRLRYMRCSVPDLNEIIPVVMHNLAFSVTMRWSEIGQAWMFENTAVGQTGSEILPRAGTLAWEKLKCDAKYCSTLSCSQIAWQRNGECVRDLYPVNLLIDICFVRSLDNTACMTSIDSLLDISLSLFLSRLRESTVDILLQLNTLMNNTAREDVQIISDIDQTKSLEKNTGEFLLYFRFPHDARNFDYDQEFLATDFEAINVAVLKSMPGVKGTSWVRICSLQSRVANSGIYVVENKKQCGANGTDFLFLAGTPSTAVPARSYVHALVLCTLLSLATAVKV